MTELHNNDGIKVEDEGGTLVASMDIADDDHRTIVLKYMPDGTIAMDCENDPALLEKYADQIKSIINQNSLLPRIPSMRELFANLNLGKPARYSPCIECGNPAKGGHCFKCQKKKGAT